MYEYKEHKEATNRTLDVPTLTSNAQKNSTERNPSIFAIPFHVVYNVLWIESSQYTNIIFEQVVKTNASNEWKPHQDNRGKGKTHFVSAKSLNREENDQDCYWDPNNSTWNS